MNKKGAYVIVGAQWGDEGKGLISAYITAREGSRLVARAGTGANAEHGIFLRDKLTYLKVNQLPLGWMFNPNCEIRIGSGVCVDPVKLISESERYGLKDRVKIDFRCPIITPEHIIHERNSKGMSSIGSTFSGTGFCRADAVLRKGRRAVDIPALKEYLVDLGNEINNLCEEGIATVESSQGFGLGLYTSTDYPNCTSDNVSSVAAADDVLLSWKNIKEVIMVVKALPTREGAGSFGNANELEGDYVKKHKMDEPSSIGGVQRRKADCIDFELLRYATKINGATQIALTFCDHYDKSVDGAIKPDEITDKVWNLIDKIQLETKVPVTILNTGKSYDNIVDLSTNDKLDWEKINNNIMKMKG